MRIAIWHNLPSGGGKRALFEHCRGLVERGHSLGIWCPETADESYLGLESFGPVHVLPLRWKPAATSKRAIAQAIAHRANVKAMWAAMEAHCQEVARELNQQSFDVVFANSSPFVCASPLARFTPVPSLLYLQEPFRELYEARPIHPMAAIARPQRGRWWSPGYMTWFVSDLIRNQANREQVRDERRNAAAFKRLLVNSHYSRESVLRAYGLESRVCYLGVDAQAFSPGSSERLPFVLGLGAFLQTKGVDRAIGGLAQIPEPERPELVWVANVVNPGVRLAMEGMARDLGVRLTVHSGISDEELIGLLQQARLLVYTSRLEPFGFAPLEALACGTPVVGVAEGGIRETVPHGHLGWLADDACPESIAGALRKALADKELGPRVRREGPAWVREHWDWSKAVDRLERHLVEVAGGSGCWLVGCRVGA